MNHEFLQDQFDLQKAVFVFALESEAGAEFADYPVLYTGIGKINAAIALQDYLHKHSPEIVINLGTAGSTDFEKGSLVCCNQFVQRDMDVTELGFPKYKTPFSDDDIPLKYGLCATGIPNGICGSGDHFEVSHNSSLYNVVDMEAYALAKVAKLHDIPFLCVKYISDGADDSAAEDWTVEVRRASKKLSSFFGFKKN